MDLEQLKHEIIRLGKSLIYNLFVLIKTSKNYQEGHSAMNTPIKNILNTVKEIHQKKEDASLMLKGGYILLSENRLRADAAGFEAFNFIMGTMKGYYIGSINFTSTASAKDLAKLPYIFKELEPIPSPQTFQKFLNAMQSKNIQGIEVEMLPEEENLPEEDLTDNKARSKKVYSQTIHAASEVMTNIKMGQTLKLRKSKRAIQGMIDQLLMAETNLIGLTTIRCHDEYTYNHSVNVCILSLAIGQRMGLSKASLCNLGMTALFHDIGKADVPIEILNKPSNFTIDEWEIMKRHPVYGVKLLMKLKGLDNLNARIVTGAFEHHLNYDLSGYPKVNYKKELSLFGRIISITDCYDGMTSSRVYSREPMSPDKALRMMMGKAGQAYDPVLMKLFVNSIGIYPVGSLILLSSRELAVVMQNNPDPTKWDTPRIKIIGDHTGKEVESDIFDLSSTGHGKKIVKTIDPQKFNIDVTKYFT